MGSMHSSPRGPRAAPPSTSILLLTGKTYNILTKTWHPIPPIQQQSTSSPQEPVCVPDHCPQRVPPLHLLTSAHFSVPIFLHDVNDRRYFSCLYHRGDPCLYVAGKPDTTHWCTGDRFAPWPTDAPPPWKPAPLPNEIRTPEVHPRPLLLIWIPHLT